MDGTLPPQNGAGLGGGSSAAASDCMAGGRWVVCGPVGIILARIDRGHGIGRAILAVCPPAWKKTDAEKRNRPPADAGRRAGVGKAASAVGDGGGYAVHSLAAISHESPNHRTHVQRRAWHMGRRVGAISAVCPAPRDGDHLPAGQRGHPGSLAGENAAAFALHHGPAFSSSHACGGNRGDEAAAGGAGRTDPAGRSLLPCHG